MNATKDMTTLETMRSVATALDEQPYDERLSEWGVRFTEQPIRDLGAIAWLLALSRCEDQTDQFLVVEETNISSPGCGHNPSRTATVDMLVVDLNHESMRIAREYEFDYKSQRLAFFDLEKLTARNFLRLYAGYPKLLGSLSARDAQREVEDRLYQVTDTATSPLDKEPVALVAGPIDEQRYPRMRHMIVITSLMQRHVSISTAPDVAH